MRELKRLKLDWYISRLRNQEYFSFVRWGDAEWGAITRTSGDSDGRGRYPYSPELNRRMWKSLLKYYEEKNLIFGVCDRVWKPMIQKGKIWMKKYKLWNIDWVYSEIFSQASKEGTLFPLIEELRKHKIIVIGPGRLRQLPERVFKFIDFIEIHHKKGWNDSSVPKRVLECKQKHDNNIIYSFSAGIGSNIFIPNLHKSMNENFLIDFGSVWDVFCGGTARTYMRPTRYPKSKIRKNLGIS